MSAVLTGGFESVIQIGCADDNADYTIQLRITAPAPEGLLY
jgi:hypothetical protein